MYLAVIASSERNLNPKTACLKRREEEKSEDLPGGRPMNVNAEDLAQGPMGGKVSIADCKQIQTNIWRILHERSFFIEFIK